MCLQGVPITTPEQMLAALSATPNAIGYLPSTLGASSGLAEVQLEVGPSKRITSREANLTLVVTQVEARDLSRGRGGEGEALHCSSSRS